MRARVPRPPRIPPGDPARPAPWPDDATRRAVSHGPPIGPADHPPRAMDRALPRSVAGRTEPRPIHAATAPVLRRTAPGDNRPPIGGTWRALLPCVPAPA